MRAILPVLLLFSVLSAHAAEDDGVINCKYDGNQQEMNTCAVRDFKATDSALNEKYKELMSSLSLANQQRLRKEQRAWLKMRDPKCKSEAKLSEGGSIWPLEFYGCLQSATTQRNKELEQWQHNR